MGLPSFNGDPISVSALPKLSAYRGRLLSGRPGHGTPVYAASFVRQRRIILETELFDDSSALRLVLVHEWFHFVWPRLGNPRRLSYQALLRNGRERGELGESAAVRKEMARADARYWKDYVCESFCDTAAWIYAGVRDHRTFTLARRWRAARASWFLRNFEAKLVWRTSR
jgi:hypothetical protein